MKKTVFFFLLLYLIPCSLFAISGSGTFASPYHGTITADTVWNTSSNKIYVNGTITVTAHLTINQGLTIVFVTAGANLIITGNGILTASGGSGANMIRFTADFNNNGIYGESGETWGHIAFTGNGNSTLTFCIIEWGKKVSSGAEGYGGGVYIYNSNVTISNCILRNNYALWGGGIMIDQSVSPLINNCLIYSNTSTQGGGGIEIEPGASPVFNNCIVRNNSNIGTTYGGGGGLFWQSGQAKIINCTIVNNTSTRGVNVYFYVNGSNSASLINTIAWSDENCVFFNGTAQSSNLINSAVQRVYSYSGTIPISFFTNCIALASSNTATDGPNFTDPSSDDWSITFISPCRDAGTSGYSAPTLDYIGNGRIGQYDIGAYENQYSRWIGGTSGQETDWDSATNWLYSITPSTSMNVVIPAVTYNPSITSTDVTITNLATETGGILTVAANRLLTSDQLTNGGSVIFNPGAKGTITTVVNNGTLKLGSDATGISSFITNSFSGSDATVEIYLVGGSTPDHKWHYISSPVSSLPVNTFAPALTIDFAQFVESRPTTNLLQGWMGYDSYDYYNGGFVGGYYIGGTNMIVGKGYDYYKVIDKDTSFSGQLNTTDVSITLGYTATAFSPGFNLLGNPFSSGLDWDYIVANNYPSNTSQGLYFTRNNLQCSYVGGVGVPGDVTGIIPPMQGFFIKANGTPDRQLTLPAAARTHNGIHNRYKGATIIPLVRLAITENSVSDETVVRFDQQAKSTLDNDFDALKMFVSPTATSIYSSMSGVNYAINGQPFPDSSVEIPVVVNLTTSGNHTISATQQQGLDNYTVTLTDNSTGFVADLKATPDLTFSASAGTITGRFILKVSYVLTGIENPVVPKYAFNIYPANNMINILPLSDVWDGKTGSVIVLDITGKTILNLNNSEFWKNSLIRVASPVAKGVYIVELKSGVLRYVGKVVIR